MKLEVGKIYKNRQGDLVKITHKKTESTSNWLYVGIFYDNGLGENVTETFQERGFYFFKTYKHRYDLIE